MSKNSDSSISVNVIKPKIPVIFLDTNFFIDFVQSENGVNKNPCYYENEKKLIEAIRKLTKQKKLLCPKSDQAEEYEQHNKFQDEIHKLQTTLSYGIRTNYNYGVKQMQIQQALKAYVNNGKEIVFDGSSLFINEPLGELKQASEQEFIVSVRFPTLPDDIKDKKERKKYLASKYEELRRENKESFPKRFEAEKLSHYHYLSNGLRQLFVKYATKISLSEADVDVLMELGRNMSRLAHLKGGTTEEGKEPEDLLEILKFYKSEYFTSIPFISIQAKLNASLVTQRDKVKETDDFDFMQTCQMLPFSSYFVTDKHLKNRLTTKPLSLDKQYDVRIYSLNEIPQLLEELNKLS